MPSENRKEHFSTSSQIEVPPFLTGHDQEEPGLYPYTRGIHPSGYRSKFWTMRQYAGFSTAKETNTRYKFLLASGQTGLSVAFDLPTQMGYDSDAEEAIGEVGKVGVAIDSLEDMEALFEGIPLDQVSTSMTINATAAILLCLYQVTAEKKGILGKNLRGTIQNDLLKEYIARGTYIYPPRPSMRIITDIFRYCQEELPQWNTISISGYHIREAGATAAQELGFTMANGISYVREALRVGLNVDDFGQRLSFFFSSDNHFFEEIAKFRAARKIWATLMKERFHAKNPKALMCRFHTQTAGSSLTHQQPNNNIVRVAYQALAAVLGGTQSLHTNSRDEALSLPTEESAEIALRTQQILAYETGVADTVDPLAGCYYLEELTRKLEEKAYEYIEIIESKGGSIPAIEERYFHKEIEKSAYLLQKQLETQERIVVSANQFITKDPEAPALFRIDERIEKEQIQQLKKLRARRNASQVQSSLNALKQAAKGTENLLPPIKECIRQYGTIGEISTVLRDVFGIYRPQ
ncbi:MAG: methylmalonyl-CoA mutase family protein [Planctomycetota bacterium]